MKLGFDTRGTDPGYKFHAMRGTGRYANELLNHLEPILKQFGTFDLVKLGVEDFEINSFFKNILKLAPYGKQTLCNILFDPLTIKNFEVDSIHFISHVDVPPFCPLPYVVTVLDLIPLKMPHLYQSGQVDIRYKIARKLEERAILKAKGLLTISEYSKKDIIETFNIDESKIFVTPLASNLSQGKVPDYLNHSKNLLYVGGIDARKKVDFMIDIFGELIKEDEFKDYSLTLVGRYEEDKNFPKLLKQIERDGLKDKIILKGKLSDEQLLKEYYSAKAFIFCSEYEGFGLPILEAMQCGLPVISIRNTCLPEVGGDAAIWIKDYNKKNWVNTLCSSLNNKELLSAHRELGLKQAKRFSWQQTAKLTAEAYSNFF